MRRDGYRIPYRNRLPYYSRFIHGLQGTIFGKYGKGWKYREKGRKNRSFDKGFFENNIDSIWIKWYNEKCMEWYSNKFFKNT